MLNSRRFYFLLVVFLLVLSVSSFADVCLTEQEFRELQTIFMRWDNRINERDALIATLQTQLETAEEQLRISSSAIKTQEQTLTELKESLRKQRGEAIKTTVVVSLITALAGLVAGLLL